MKYLLTFVLVVVLVGCASHSRQQSEAVVHHKSSPESLPYHHTTITVTTNAALVYVGGEVVQPGRIAWAQELTLTKAVALAGGFTDFADRRHIEIRHRDGGVEICNYEQAESAVTDNPVLERGDVVQVPQRLFWKESPNTAPTPTAAWVYEQVELYNDYRASGTTRPSAWLSFGSLGSIEHMNTLPPALPVQPPTTSSSRRPLLTQKQWIVFGVALGLVLPMFWLSFIASLSDVRTASDVARCATGAFVEVFHYYFGTVYGLCYMSILAGLFIWFRRPRARKQRRGDAA